MSRRGITFPAARALGSEGGGANEPLRRAKTGRELWFIVLAALALTGAFLAGPARMRMDTGTAAVVFLHGGLGLLALPTLLVWVIYHPGQGRHQGDAEHGHV